jgi:hypothetical protein
VPDPGAVHVAHHTHSAVIARLDARGTAVPLGRLREFAPSGHPHVHGVYLPVRSGTLAYYRDPGDGRVVVRHRGRKVALPDGARAQRVRVGPVQSIRFTDASGRRAGSLRYLDSPGRWRGGPLTRLYDFTMWFPEDFDIGAWIVWTRERGLEPRV